MTVSESDDSEPSVTNPDKDATVGLWRHPMWRTTYRVVTVGRKWITLRPTMPGLGETKVAKDAWPGQWERA